MKSILFVVLLALPWSVHAAEEVILLDVEIFSGEDRVSNPRVAMKSGSDASIVQGLDGDMELAISIHSVHENEDTVEMLIDTDMDGEHVRSIHQEFPWDVQFEQIFETAGPDQLRVLVTPSLTTIDALKPKE